MKDSFKDIILKTERPDISGISDVRLEYSTREEDVSNPGHYRAPGEKECIDQQREKWGDEYFIAHCEQNAFKYRFRAGRKGNENDDLKKAAWHEQMAHHVHDTRMGVPEGKISLDPRNLNWVNPYA